MIPDLHRSAVARSPENIARSPQKILKSVQAPEATIQT